MSYIGKIVENVTSGTQHEGEEAKIIDTLTDGRIVVKYDDGHVGKGRLGEHYQLVDNDEDDEDEEDDEESNYKPFNNKKSNKMSFLKKVKDYFLSEPEKTYRKLGLKDERGNLTEDGKEFLINVLWEANEATLVREKANAILADEEKDR